MSSFHIRLSLVPLIRAHPGESESSVICILVILRVTHDIWLKLSGAKILGSALILGRNNLWQVGLQLVVR